jgi:hypothetical protein
MRQLDDLIDQQSVTGLGGEDHADRSWE